MNKMFWKGVAEIPPLRGGSGGVFLLGYAVIIKYIIFFCYDVSGSSTERATGATGSDRRSQPTQ